MLRKLEKSVEEYVNTGRVLADYSSLEELYQDLDSLSEEDWASLSITISSMAPMPYSFKYGPISDQLPGIIKKSILAGIMTSIVTYYETESVLAGVAAGAFTASLAWSVLSERACKNEAHKEALLQKRVDNLLQHDRFFKPPTP